MLKEGRTLCLCCTYILEWLVFWSIDIFCKRKQSIKYMNNYIIRIHRFYSGEYKKCEMDFKLFVTDNCFQKWISVRNIINCSGEHLSYNRNKPYMRIIMLAWYKKLIKHLTSMLFINFVNYENDFNF